MFIVSLACWSNIFNFMFVFGLVIILLLILYPILNISLTYAELVTLFNYKCLISYH